MSNNSEFPVYQKAPTEAQTPSAQELQEMVHPKTEAEKKWARNKKLGAGALITVVAGLSAFIGSQLSGDKGSETPEPNPEPSVSAPVTPGETTPEVTPTGEPTSVEVEPVPVDKEWGLLELPEADAKGYRDFGSKENFMKWFEIPGDIYDTPEALAEKYAQNLEGILNAGGVYQFDEAAWDYQLNLSDPGNEYQDLYDNLNTSYIQPAYDRFLTGAEGSDEVIVNTTALNEAQLQFSATNEYTGGNYTEWKKPYQRTVEFNSLENVITGSIESGYISLKVNYQVQENTEDYIDQSLVSDYTWDVNKSITYKYDQVSGNWLLNGGTTNTENLIQNN